jgi:hypothetical protein
VTGDPRRHRTAGYTRPHRDPFREQPSPPAERRDAERPYALTGDRNGRSDAEWAPRTRWLGREYRTVWERTGRDS